MKKLPTISESEWKVADLLWQESPQTSAEIISHLESPSGWSPKTIKTLLFRLVKKGVLGFEKKKREYSYFPKIAKERYLQNESEGFLNRVFNGATSAMIAHFVKSDKMSLEEIAEIKNLLSEIEEAERTS